ncbi:uncharacterized protein SPAPADRAFT_52201 [Spathaspora passalidarum NRRL Y-27907]|uniref:Uncharacterized protein n=1 Tax=Spathaspora passalidarum (strain NRRL Y-27907 / 11-Y1) TaxID=619300 RepID=G3AS57_SPAPN|nr:uncharacterized protein SPAPADRAFT_52201 [Spathaspora passalidarum NRRL Y-27907]EGW31016.1 hypothetical protein SPAPADRAFT_52201 [Spathaspora passalidarum NRRL Y-27907]
MTIGGCLDYINYQRGEESIPELVPRKLSIQISSSKSDIILYLSLQLWGCYIIFRSSHSIGTTLLGVNSPVTLPSLCEEEKAKWWCSYYFMAITLQEGRMQGGGIATTSYPSLCEEEKARKKQGGGVATTLWLLSSLCKRKKQGGGVVTTSWPSLCKGKREQGDGIATPRAIETITTLLSSLCNKYGKGPEWWCAITLQPEEKARWWLWGYYFIIITLKWKEPKWWYSSFFYLSGYFSFCSSWLILSHYTATISDSAVIFLATISDSAKIFLGVA